MLSRSIRCLHGGSSRSGPYLRRARRKPLLKPRFSVPSAASLPRHSPRDRLWKAPLLRRRHLARLQRHQRTMSYVAEKDTTPEPVNVLALPLCHRPLLPGMTIQLQLPVALYNKMITQMHLAEHDHNLVGAFLVDTETKNEPLSIGGREVPNFEPSAPISPALFASQFVDVPHLNDIHHIGTLCRIITLSVDRQLVLESLQAIEAHQLKDPELLVVSAFPLADDVHNSHQDVELKTALVNAAKVMVGINSRYAPQLELVIRQADDTELGTLVNQIAGLCTNLAPLQEQQLLAERNVAERARSLFKYISINETAT